MKTPRRTLPIRRIALTLLAVAIFTFAQTVRLVAQAATLEQRLREVLTSALATQQLVGGTAAISIDGRVVAVAAGFADRERQIPMTINHRMLVGSAGKTFFSFITTSLANEGRFDLDAPIATWLGNEPWFVRIPNANQITMRHLLSHRSGIPNHVADSVFIEMVRSASGERRARGFSPIEQISLVLDRPPAFQAGQGFLYSDTGYLIAALALERIAGRTYYEELARRVLKPLRLSNTSPSDHAKLRGLPQGYIRPPAPPAAAIGFATWGLPERMVSNGRLVLNPAYEWTGGGLISTTSDLARWMETLFERETFKTIGGLMVSQKPAGAPYGLGIFVQQTGEGVVYSHPGGFPGYRTEVAYSSELGVGLAFQANESAPGGASVIPLLLAAVRAARLAN